MIFSAQGGPRTNVRMPTYATRMNIDLPEVRDSIESLRSVGLFSRTFATEQEANDWRSAMRRACRTEHLRVRTFNWPERGGDGTVRLRVYVEHLDRAPVSLEDLWGALEALPTPPGWRRENPGAQGGYRAGRRQATGQRENIFMEITRRDDIGSDLKAPSAARGGVPTPGYALVSTVRPGDKVVHYDSRREAIVGVSVACGAPESAPIYWVARGSYARRAGEKASWLPGTRVALGGYRPLAPPLVMTQIRDKKDQILSIRSRILASSNGRPIYFPWIPYQDTLRTFQSYLV
jgi:hypothetical protein